jgi:hypothetical protein
MTIEKQEQPLRVIIEIPRNGGEPKIFPIADCDVDRRQILDAVRIFLSEEEIPL